MGKRKKPHSIPNQEQPALLSLSTSTKQGHVSPQLLLHVLFHTIIGSTVTGSKGKGKIPSWVAPNPKCCTYGKVQQIKTWSPHPHFGIKFFQICLSWFAPVWRENQENALSAEKKKIKPYLIGIEPGEGRSKMQGNNRKYFCFWNDPHTSSLSYNAQMSWKLSATPSGIPPFLLNIYYLGIISLLWLPWKVKTIFFSSPPRPRLVMKHLPNKIIAAL